MRFKYNFGVLKDQKIGIVPFDESIRPYIGTVKKVSKVKKKDSPQPVICFEYENGYKYEIAESAFIYMVFMQENEDEYYFMETSPEPTCKFLNPLIPFTMFDTFGFPLEMTHEEFGDEYLMDIEGFELLKQLQKKKSSGSFKNKEAFG